MKKSSILFEIYLLKTTTIPIALIKENMTKINEYTLFKASPPKKEYKISRCNIIIIKKHKRIKTLLFKINELKSLYKEK